MRSTWIMDMHSSDTASRELLLVEMKYSANQKVEMCPKLHLQMWSLSRHFALSLSRDGTLFAFIHMLLHYDQDTSVSSQKHILLQSKDPKNNHLSVPTVPKTSSWNNSDYITYKEPQRPEVPRPPLMATEGLKNNHFLADLAGTPVIWSTQETDKWHQGEKQCMFCPQQLPICTRPLCV